ncbi:non-ribosomal peptide synthetase [Phycicoccus sp. MAQZ13P-2]|uniref:non-ribosomal peptide synthetase n=1 Tax=Phycicoccus mangrovi TaxID=2840470 RepID=UPI001BFFFC28|nr:non-ribosomal peptide synthetase [Phycicoccus mangrovi]MBT9254455.1 non-ribosomal peptide synthetase [Phycicoccus mangrovi]MBT9272833.1 non-ribosomal peptide synthetase [Phycicoccus mangrovi]
MPTLLATAPLPGAPSPTLAPDGVSLTRLAALGGRTALHTADGPVSYADLAARAADVVGLLPSGRSLVHVRASATVATVVQLVAARAAGHVVLLSAPGRPARSLAEAYDPDAVLAAEGVDVLRTTSAHDLHPELALLMSTSGSTGSPKLVRLSQRNLLANTAQVRAALGVRPDDVAALTLPLSYCYGLSVLLSHLDAGASVLLTDRSVVDDCFWEQARAAGVTTIPGVPHTFELLERSGFAERSLPTLRQLTQAGGRMDPERVRRVARLGRERGHELVVMYGQCEATARMACLAADLVEDHPDCVGTPVPGGSVRIDDGEIVYAGPNVMLGYAERPADLALGRTVDELHTGDLGEVTPEGLLRVTGRRARFVKVLGHRVALDTVEGALRADGHDVRVAGRDGLLAVSVRGASSAPARERVRRAAVRASGVPADAVRVVAVDEHPLLPSGKPDHRAVLAQAAPAEVDAGAATVETDAGVAALYSTLLHRPAAPDSTFASLGGDSLSFVEVSVRLEELLGHLPRGWHLMTVAQLDAVRRSPVRASGLRLPRWRTVETSVALRALAIVLVVGTHTHLFTLQGSANALLVVAGFQLARFQLASPDPGERSRGLLGAALRLALPTLVVVWAAHFLLGLYAPRNLVLMNWALGAEHLGPPWRFWFVEALLVALVGLGLLVRLPGVTALDRRHPLLFPVGLSVAAFVAFRLPVLDLPTPRMQGAALVVLHLVLLGWALARATSTGQRLALTALSAAMVMTFSGNPSRDGLTLACVLALLWVPTVRLPGPVVPVARVLASASLFVYVAHWQVLQWTWGLPEHGPALGLVLGTAAGLAYWWLWTGPVTRGWSRLTALVRARGPQSALASPQPCQWLTSTQQLIRRRSRTR